MNKKLFLLLIMTFLSETFTFGQYFQLEKKPNIQGSLAGPYMIGCNNYGFDIKINSDGNTFPNAISDIKILYDPTYISINSFLPGTAYDSNIIAPSLSSGIIDIRRFSTIGSIKNNALFGTIFFTPTTITGYQNFSMPFGINNKTEGNNFPNDNNTDLLQNVFDTGFVFLTGPCIRDMQSPLFSFAGGVSNLSGASVNASNANYIAENSNIAFTITDNIADAGGSSEYGYNILNQYVPGISTNQFGVDLSSMEITVQQAPYKHKYLHPIQLPTTISSYNQSTPGVSNSNFDITRERLAKNYNVTINPALDSFYPERLITLSGVVRDRINRRGRSNTGLFTLSFNAPQPPIVTAISPINNQTITTNLTGITLKIEDLWAGVDIESVVINVNGIDYTTLSSGFSYISGLRVLGDPNFGDYYIITIIPSSTFGFGSDVTVTTSGMDLVGTTMLSSYSFKQYACFGSGSGILPITIGGTTIDYTGTSLIVEGEAYLEGNKIIVGANQNKLYSPSYSSYGARPTVFVQSEDTVLNSAPLQPIEVDGGQNITIYGSGGQSETIYLPGKTSIVYRNVYPKTSQTTNNGAGSGDLGYEIVKGQNGEIDQINLSPRNVVVTPFSFETNKVIVGPEQQVEYITNTKSSSINGPRNFIKNYGLNAFLLMIILSQSMIIWKYYKKNIRQNSHLR